MSPTSCLSVIMPAFNEEATIAACVERVLASPWTAEIIVVDEASDDGTPELLAHFRDDRVRTARVRVIAAAQRSLAELAARVERNLLHGAVTGLGDPNSLINAGIELQRDGSLKLNETRFAPLLTTPAKLSALFAQTQSGADTASRGFGVRFKDWASALTADTGVLAGRTTGISRSLDLNQKAQDAQQDKLTRTEARLRAQYQRLDSQMSSLNAQMAQMKSALGLNQTSQ